MKTLIILLSLIITSVSFAGEIRTTPLDIVLSNPTTDQVNLVSMTFHYGTNPSATIRFEVLDDTGRVYKTHNVHIWNGLDNPETTEVDESTTDFTDFVAGYGATLYSRGDAAIWAYIQSFYTVQAK